MSLRGSSILPDPTPISDLRPEPPVQPKPEPSDLEKVANNPAEYKEIDSYLQSRIEYYQKFLPDGTPIQNLKTKEEKVQAWDTATSIIQEFEGLRNTFRVLKRNVAK